MSKEHQRQIYAMFSTLGIHYHPGLARVFNDVATGIFLSQMLYWYGTGSSPDGWVYKTAIELRRETGLSQSQQERVIDLCRGHDILDYKLARVPATRHFRLKLDNLVKAIRRFADSGDLDPNFDPNQFNDFIDSITENTHQTTSETTTYLTPLNNKEIGENAETSFDESEKLESPNGYL